MLSRVTTQPSLSHVQDKRGRRDRGDRGRFWGDGGKFGRGHGGHGQGHGQAGGHATQKERAASNDMGSSEASPASNDMFLHGNHTSNSVVSSVLSADQPSPSNHQHPDTPSRRREGIKWTVGKHYTLPRRVVANAFESLDAVDLPDMPGILHRLTLLAAVRRFDASFRQGQTERQAQMRQQEIERIMSKIQTHTLRRRGQQAVKQGLLEWEQTSHLYDLFSVELNIFERIFFIIDVSEGTGLLSKICSSFLVGLIVVSISSWVLSTLPSMQEVPHHCNSMLKGQCEPEPLPVFKSIETFCVYVFSLEYLLRLLTVHSVRFGLLDEDLMEGLLCDEGRGMKSWVLKIGSNAMGTLGAHFPRNFSSTRSSILGGATSSFRSTEEVEDRRVDGKLMTVIKHTTRPANLIDLCAILPFWLERLTSSGVGGGGALLVLRLLRLSRVFRVFKLGKYNDAFTLFTRVVSQSVPALSLMVFFIGIGCCLFGTLMWFFEQGEWYPEGHPKLIQLGIEERGAYLRPDGSRNRSEKEESPFPSILHSFWFVIVTITTVGYGDVYPTTPAGKLVGAATILNGIIVLAMPIGVVGANFSNEYYRVLDEKKRRARMKHRLDSMRELEAEQDALIRQQLSQVESSEQLEAAEQQRVATAQQGLKDAARLIEESWSPLPDVLREDLLLELRNVLMRLFSSDNMTHTMATTPVLSTARLSDLDRLTNRVHDVLLRGAVADPNGTFCISNAFKCRKDWAAFVDSYWEYVVSVCHVKKAPDPPEFFELKAYLARLSAPQMGSSSSPAKRSWRGDHIAAVSTPMSERHLNAKAMASEDGSQDLCWEDQRADCNYISETPAEAVPVPPDLGKFDPAQPPSPMPAVLQGEWASPRQVTETSSQSGRQARGERWAVLKTLSVDSIGKAGANGNVELQPSINEVNNEREWGQPESPSEADAQVVAPMPSTLDIH